jgi:hypothetical protein
MAADAPGSALFAEVGRCPGCLMAAYARVLLARAHTQTLQPSLPPLATITISLKMGGSRVGSELYQQTIYSSLEEPFSTGSSFSQKLCMHNAVGAGGGWHGCGSDSVKL